MLPSEMLNACIAFYFTRLYAIFPIINPWKLGDILATMNVSIEMYCSIIALCAYIFLSPASTLTPELLHVENHDNLSTIDRGKCYWKRVRFYSSLLKEREDISLIGSFHSSASSHEP